jgi:hypothetical protein
MRKFNRQLGLAHPTHANQPNSWRQLVSSWLNKQFF